MNINCTRPFFCLLLGGLLASPLAAAGTPDEDVTALERPLPRIELAPGEAPLDESSFDGPAPPPPPIDLDYRPSPAEAPE
jgi:hypothetical protein